MRRWLTICAAVFFGLLLSLALASPANAQDKNKAKKEDRLSGVVHMINKDTSTITIRKGNVRRDVVYNSDTKFVKGKSPYKPASLEEIAEGKNLVCVGRFDDKTRLVASTIRIRD